MEDHNADDAQNLEKPPVPASMYGVGRWNQETKQWELIQKETPKVDQDWMQQNLPGYSLEEAMALSLAGLNSATDQSSSYMKEQALIDLSKWLLDSFEYQRAKRLLFIRRQFTDQGLANREVLEQDGWQIPR